VLDRDNRPLTTTLDNLYVEQSFFPVEWWDQSGVCIVSNSCDATTKIAKGYS